MPYISHVGICSARECHSLLTFWTELGLVLSSGMIKGIDFSSHFYLTEGE